MPGRCEAVNTGRPRWTMIGQRKRSLASGPTTRLLHAPFPGCQRVIAFCGDGVEFHQQLSKARINGIRKIGTVRGIGAT